MHTFTKFFALAAMLSLIVLQGCENERPTEPHPTPPDVPYYPMALGNTWIGQVDGMMVGGHGDTSTVTGRTSSRVIGQTTHSQGFELWTLEDVDSLIYCSPNTLYTVIDTSLAYVSLTDYEVNVYDDTITAEHEILFKLPLTVGETWTPYPNYPTVTREVISLTDSVTVPAGSFSDCLLMRDDNSMGSAVWNYYFAPDIGQARMTADSGLSSHVSERLMSFVIN